MSKETSTQIKGIAILLMIWLHCFHSGWHTGMFTDLELWGDDLSSILTRLTHPVEFYIILSGYGLYCLYHKTHRIDIWQRAMKFYILFLLCFIFFIPIACIVKLETYPGSIIDFTLNITTWKTTYNSTWWFLFPYLVILLLSNLIFRVYEQKSILILIVSALIYVVCYGLAWLTALHYIEPPYAIHQTLKTLDFLFPFLIGSSFAKYNIIQKVKHSCDNNKKLITFIILVMIVVVARFLTDFDFGLQIIYTVVVILAYAILPHFNTTTKVLQSLGKHSTARCGLYMHFFACTCLPIISSCLNILSLSSQQQQSYLI